MHPNPLHPPLAALPPGAVPSSHHHWLLFNTVPLGVIFMDAAGRVLAMNPAAERITGSTADQINATPPEDQARNVIREDGSPLPAAELPAALALRTGREVRDHVIGFTPGTGGPTRWIRCTAVPLFPDGASLPAQVYNLIEDITDQRRHDETLRTTREQYRLLVEHQTDFVAHLTRDGRRLYVNPNYRRLVGKTESEVLTSDYTPELHPDDAPRVAALWPRTFEAPDYRTEIEVRARAANGSWRWISWRNTAILDDHGQATTAICVGRDITEKKRVQHQLLTTLESIADGFFTLDAEWRFEYVNAVAERLMGMSRNDLLGKSHWDVFPLTVGTNLEAEYRRAAAGESRTFENHYQPWNRWFRMNCYPREGGGMSVFFQDVTARHRAEAALRASEHRWRGTFEQAAVGMALVALDGRWLRVNQKFCDIVGYTHDELQSVTFQAITHPDDLAGDLAHVRQLLDGKLPNFSMEKRYVRKDGSHVWVNLTAALVRDEHDRPDHFISIIEDISARKRAEEELTRAKEQAESANIAKDRFLAVLSHELRTPLTPVLALASALSTDPSLPQSVRDDLLTIRHGVQTEARLIDDLLDLTRIARGKVELHPELVDVRRVLQAAADACRPAADAKALALTLDLCTAPQSVWADPARLQQILLNLLQNAIKFTPRKGAVNVRTRTSQFAQGSEPDSASPDARAAGALLIDIQDTGIGIPEDRLPHIFEPFEQGERTITRKYGGLGLGLSIARSLAQLHQGTLTASSPGRSQGSTFTLTLPAIPAPHLPTSPSPHPPSSTSPLPHPPIPHLSVLLVEDHPDTLRILSRLIRAAGFKVLTAASVADAIAVIDRGDPFDLLLSDIGLPDGSGTDIMRHLASVRPHVRGVAVSGFGMEDDLRRSREAGFTEHLTKPVTPQTIIDTLRRLQPRPE